MDDSESPHQDRIPSLGPIPRELYSEYEERPFRICTRCGESLADFQEGYRVSKVFSRGEVLFEYALCGPCFLDIYDESSDETKIALMQFQQSHMRDDVEHGKACALCANEKDAIEDANFALVGACLSDQLLDIHLVCSKCTEQMNELVSKKTRDVWDRFVEDNFPGVPADFEPLPTSTPVLI